MLDKDPISCERKKNIPLLNRSFKRTNEKENKANWKKKNID